jgi:cytochrome c-type biogenesis protein CcmH/NrfG
MRNIPFSPRRTLWITALFLIGVAAWNTGNSSADPNDKQRAASALEQDVKADPNNAELWLHLGYAYRKDNQIDLAQNAFEKASTLNPHSDNALFMLALIYEKKHQSQDALKAWQRYLAVETNPSERAVAEKHIHLLSQ